MFNTNNTGFYPTPAALAYKLIEGLSFGNNGCLRILEPSAGKGDIVAVIQKKMDSYYRENATIDCIEVDPLLQSVLKGKGFRVIADDFLTFETLAPYDLIVMNPPFNNGAAHLLKAIEIQERHGGLVRCILNAETIKNPFSRERQELLRKLNNLEATISFYQNEFSEAERQTDVEVAIISMKVPAKSSGNIILDSLKTGRPFFEESSQKQWLTEADFIEAIVANCNFEINAGITLIKEVESMAPFIRENLDSKTMYNNPVLDLRICGKSYSSSNNETISQYVEAIRRKYWKALFASKDFSATMTTNMRDSYMGKIEELSKFDFSKRNIYQIKAELNASLVESVEESIINLFDELSHKYSYLDETSANVHLYNGWKSNKAYKIATKVIIPMRNSWNQFTGNFNPDWSCIDKLSDLERALNLLDGNPKQETTVREAIEAAVREGKSRGIVCRHFSLSFYKKGTCHIFFSNISLLDKLNIFGAQKKNWLPPAYGKKNYKDLDDESKTVINEFQGEESYNGVINNSNYYLSSPGQKLLAIS
jgi:hypothetical protein